MDLELDFEGDVLECDDGVGEREGLGVSLRLRREMVEEIVVVLVMDEWSLSMVMVVVVWCCLRGVGVF